MIIFPEWRGRFGNQLFQYSFGRILHLRSGRAVFFPDKFSIDLWTPANLPGITFDGEPIEYERSHFGFDWSILQKPVPLKISGNFEDFRYFAGYREHIRTWLPLPELPDVEEDEVIVHMRRGDFCYRRHCSGRQVSTQAATPVELIIHAIESFGTERDVRIITDDPQDDQVLNVAATSGARIESQGPKEDFLTLCAAKSVVMSPSTFSWWATFLGNPKRVVCPLWEYSHWHLGMQGNENFARPQITDDPRYEYPVWRLFWMLDGEDLLLTAKERLVV